MPAPDAATSSIMMADSVRPSPRPPYSSGIIAPSQPPSANARTNSQGYSPFLSFSRQYPRSNRRASSRADLRTRSRSRSSVPVIVGSPKSFLVRAAALRGPPLLTIV